MLGVTVVINYFAIQHLIQPFHYKTKKQPKILLVNHLIPNSHMALGEADRSSVSSTNQSQSAGPILLVIEVSSRISTCMTQLKLA